MSGCDFDGELRSIDLDAPLRVRIIGSHVITIVANHDDGGCTYEIQPQQEAQPS